MNTPVINHFIRIRGPTHQKESETVRKLRKTPSLGPAANLAGQRHFQRQFVVWHRSCLRDWKHFPVTVSHPGIRTLLHKEPRFHPRGLVLSHTWWNRTLRGLRAPGLRTDPRWGWHGFLSFRRVLSIFRRIRATNLDKNTFESSIIYISSALMQPSWVGKLSFSFYFTVSVVAIFNRRDGNKILNWKIYFSKSAQLSECWENVND